MAHDFLDQDSRNEFNSIKHGLRVSSGGFHVAVGPDGTGEEATQRNQMTSLGGSRYGSTFFVPESLIGRRHFRVRRVSVNWDPENLLHGLRLAALSIANVQAFLRVIKGVDPSRVTLRRPRDAESFDELRARQVGVLSFKIDTMVPREAVKDFTKDEILAVYQDSTEDAGEA